MVQEIAFDPKSICLLQGNGLRGSFIVHLSAAKVPQLFNDGQANNFACSQGLYLSMAPLKKSK